MKLGKSLLGVCILAAAAGTLAQAQEGNKEVITIPKEQYQKMLKVLEEHDKLAEEMKEMKAFKARMEESQKKATAQQAETDQAIDDLEKQGKVVKQMAKDSFPGSTKFLMTGYGSAGFISQNNDGARQFGASFNPLFLWKVSDRLLFEGEFEAQLEGHETSLALEIAQTSYLLNDYVTLGAGKFLNPMNYFVERQHMGWVNKLPNKPLSVYDGLLAETEVGFQVRGGVPVGTSKLGYSFFVANAPELRSSTNSADAAELGTLEFNNFDNTDKHVAVGGRVGLSPLPELEFGYGFQVSDVAPSGTHGDVTALLQSADLSYVRDSARLKGVFNLKAQWVWSHIDNFTYDPPGTGFKNNRNGGYAQVAYRPSRVANDFIKNLEAVFRYDLLNQANTPTGVDETRYTVGLNYWLGPTTVFKTAYEFDEQSGSNAEHHNAVLVQFVTGF